MWLDLIRSFIPNRWEFKWRYWLRQTPWDTHITPPEVMAFIAHTTPGKALDLGCGTGTNAITLARHGWHTTGIDFASKAIRIARRRAAGAGLKIEFHTADVTDFHMLTDVYDYALDIGCLFTLAEKDRIKYADALARLLQPHGWYMLYAWLPRPWKGGLRGISAEEVESLLRTNFLKERTVRGEENGYPTAWYWFRRR